MKKWFDKECHEARKRLMILDVIKDKENYQKHLREYKRLVQRNRRIWKVIQQFLQMQEKAHACAKIWGNLKGKCVESYGDLNLLNLSMYHENLYELSLVGKMMCYGSLSHMCPFFTIKDICIGLKKLASQKAIKDICISLKCLNGRERRHMHG